MDKTVFVLQHSYEYGDDNEYTETKLIGIYSSMEKAKETVNKLKTAEGFREYPLDCFYITKYMLDEDDWTEGFVSWEDAESYRAENNLCEGDEYKTSVYNTDETE